MVVLQISVGSRSPCIHPVYATPCHLYAVTYRGMCRLLASRQALLVSRYKNLSFSRCLRPYTAVTAYSRQIVGIGSNCRAGRSVRPRNPAIAVSNLLIRNFSACQPRTTMSANRIDGTAIAQGIRQKLSAEIKEAQKANPRFRPGLTIFQGRATGCPLSQ